MKYNWSIIGHEKQLSRIERDIGSGNISHAYLLAGTNSVGKFTVARKMAGILQCNDNFCHKCPTCLQVQKGIHLDTIELRDNKESIKIADIRALIERVNMTHRSNYRIVLIQSAERMTTEAANSFLHVLEEPPSGTIFILTTNSIRSLLPTIISRVRTVSFNSVSASYLQKKLLSLYPDCDEQTAKQVSLFSLGKTGKAVHLMENPESLALYLKTYHDVQNFLSNKNVADRFNYVDDLLDEGSSPEVFFNILTHVVRTKLLEGDGESSRYIRILSGIEDALFLMKKNINSRLVLENLMLSL